MAQDIYHWRMSAASHSESINMLKREIEESHANQTALEMLLILELLPLQTEQHEEVRDRGYFNFQGDEFSNTGDDELWIEFYDPVLEEFTITIPKEWKGKLERKDDKLSIIFEQPLELEIARLASMGVDRSLFQKLIKMIITPSASLSILEDGGDVNKITVIQADIEDISPADYEFVKSQLITDETESFSASMKNLFDKDGEKDCDSCLSDCPEEKKWYVLNRSGACIVHGSTVYGANGYKVEYGPDTQDNCYAWIANNCGVCYASPDCV